MDELADNSAVFLEFANPGNYTASCKNTGTTAGQALIANLASTQAKAAAASLAAAEADVG